MYKGTFNPVSTFLDKENIQSKFSQTLEQYRKQTISMVSVDQNMIELYIMALNDNIPKYSWVVVM